MVERTPPTIWAIVLNWNGWRDAIACLESLKMVRVPLGHAFHVLIVDNGSTNESKERLQTFAREGSGGLSCDFLETGENLGFGAGNNAGIRRAMTAGAQWILILNNDTIVDAAFLEHLVRAGEDDTRIAFLNPKIYVLSQDGALSRSKKMWFAGGRVNWLHTRGTHRGHDTEDHGQYDDPPVQDSAYATGCCLLARSSALETIGLLPEDYFLYDEDVAWSLRAKQHGLRCVFVSRAQIWHKGAASSREHSATYIRYHVRNGLLLARRTGNAWQVTGAYFLTIPRSIWQIVKWFLFPQKRLWAEATLAGMRDAWLGHWGAISPL